LVAGGVVGWQRRTRKENHGDGLQARTGFYNGAQILAGNLLAFGLGNDDVRRLAVQDVERFWRLSDDYEMVTIFFQDFAQRARQRNPIRRKEIYWIGKR
jgi:hypothetical protein